MGAPRLVHVRARNQITLPRAASAQAHIRPGDILELVVDGGALILKPRRLEEETYTNDELDKLEKLVRRQVRRKQYTDHDTVDGARAHLRKLRS